MLIFKNHRDIFTSWRHDFETSYIVLISLFSSTSQQKFYFSLKSVGDAVALPMHALLCLSIIMVILSFKGEAQRSRMMNQSAARCEKDHRKNKS